MDVRLVLKAFRDLVRAEQVQVEAGASMATSEATHSEARSEGKYDTRSTEASYLARGQAERIAVLRRELAWFEAQLHESRVPLLQLWEGGAARWVLLAPVAGGRRVSVDGQEVVVVTPASPLGEALAEAEPGDEVTYMAGGRLRTVEFGEP